MKGLTLATAVVLLVAATAYAENEPTGKEVYEARCSELCHDLPDPGTLSAKQWERVLQTMQTRMRQFGMPPLTEQELAAVLEYVSAGSKN